MVTFTLNGQKVAFDGDQDMPLLWYIRDEAQLAGTKYGCGVAACGACTVLAGGTPIRSCSTPVAAVEGQVIKTIEGLETETEKAVQAAWRELEVAQCGYCQSGQIMSATALLSKNLSPTDDDIDAAMDGNLCRCATYHRIRAAIHNASKRLTG